MRSIAEILADAKPSGWPSDIDNYDESIVILMKDENARIARISVFQDTWDRSGLKRYIQYRDKVYVTTQKEGESTNIDEKLRRLADPNPERIIISPKLNCSDEN